MYQRGINLILSYLRPFDNILKCGYEQGQGQGSDNVVSHLAQVHV